MPSSPFPWLPVVTIAMLRVTAGYIDTSQFAYAGYMVKYLDVVQHKDQAGYFSGLLVSSFMMGRFSSSYLWGRFADRYGRLPVIYFGLVAIGVLSTAFGMATSFWWAIGFRFLMGLLTGVTPVARAMISEVSGKEHEAVGMSIMTTAWSTTTVIAPGIGGLLAEPATHYPEVFSQSGLLGRHPYLLPNLVAAGLASVSLLMVLFFLPETKQPEGGDDEVDDGDLSMQEPTITNDKDTSPSQELVTAGSTDDAAYHSDNDGGALPNQTNAPVCNGSKKGGFRKVDDDDYQSDGDKGHNGRTAKNHTGSINNGFHQVNGGEGPDGTVFDRDSTMKLLPPSRLLSEPHVQIFLFMQGLYSFLDNGFDEVFPLWALSTVARGGLDWTTEDIGKALFSTGVSIMVFELAVKPFFIKDIGIRRAHCWGSIISLVVFVTVPFMSVLHGTGLPLIATALALLFLLQASANALSVNLVVAVNNSVEPERLGEVNGLASTASSLGRAFAPFTCAPLFAWFINSDHPFPFDSHFSFILLALGMLVFTITGWRHIEYDRQKEQSHDEIVELAPVGDLV